MWWLTNWSLFLFTRLTNQKPRWWMNYAMMSWLLTFVQHRLCVVEKFKRRNESSQWNLGTAARGACFNRSNRGQGEGNLVVLLPGSQGIRPILDLHLLNAFRAELPADSHCYTTWLWHAFCHYRLERCLFFGYSEALRWNVSLCGLLGTGLQMQQGVFQLLSGGQGFCQGTSLLLPKQP